jgi:hypothetical protein
LNQRAVFVVDANVFIEAKNRYYAFLICPGFWDALVWHGGSGVVCSVDLVKRELLGGNDDLAGWVKTTAPPDAFHTTNDADAVAWYGRIVNWVQSEPRFKPEAKAEFAQAADPWLVAYARAHGMRLVTQETPDPMSRKEVKIPDVCRQFGVKCANTFEMLEDLGVRFSWQAAS